jgi:hypothetical protein
MIIITFLLTWIVGYMIVSRNTEVRNFVLRGTLSFSLVICTMSVLFCLSLFAGIPAVLCEILIAVPALIYLVVNRRRINVNHAIARVNATSGLVMPVSLALLIWFCYQYFGSVVRWGEWDAWAIWSQHGRFLTDGEYFSHLFSAELAWTHPDYPLMLPSLLAMLWNSFGFTAYVPAIVAWVISMMLLLLILGSFYERKRKFLGMLLLFLIVYSEILFPFVASQYADTLLAMFILLPFVIINHTPVNKPCAYLLLTGFFAAGCAWIKNEGMAFFLFFTICFVVYNHRKFRTIKFYVAGTLLPLMMLGVFKILYPFPSDFLTDSDAAMDKLTDLPRYQVVLEYGHTWFSQNAELLWMSMIVILLMNYRYYISMAFVVILLLTASYFLVYIITPFDLPWHLSTSFDRLIHQLTPVLLYSIFMSIGDKRKSFIQIRTFKSGPIFSSRAGEEKALQ